MPLYDADRRLPSGDASTWRTCALMFGANVVMSAPVVMSYARRFERGVSFVPAAAPAGRALENEPAAYTTLPTTAWSHTMPLICTVGSESAVTVVGSPGGGLTSAFAGVTDSSVAMMTAPIVTPAMATARSRPFPCNAKAFIRISPDAGSPRLPRRYRSDDSPVKS